MFHPLKRPTVAHALQKQWGAVDSANCSPVSRMSLSNNNETLSYVIESYCVGMCVLGGFFRLNKQIQHKLALCCWFLLSISFLSKNTLTKSALRLNIRGHISTACFLNPSAGRFPLSAAPRSLPAPASAYLSAARRWAPPACARLAPLCSHRHGFAYPWRTAGHRREGAS